MTEKHASKQKKLRHEKKRKTSKTLTGKKKIEILHHDKIRSVRVLPVVIFLYDFLFLNCFCGLFYYFSIIIKFSLRNY